MQRFIRQTRCSCQGDGGAAASAASFAASDPANRDRYPYSTHGGRGAQDVRTLQRDVSTTDTQRCFWLIFLSNWHRAGHYARCCEGLSMMDRIHVGTGAGATFFEAGLTGLTVSRSASSDSNRLSRAGGFFFRQRQRGAPSRSCRDRTEHTHVHAHIREGVEGRLTKAGHRPERGWRTQPQ
jgi:hypothetical protein